MSDYIKREDALNAFSRVYMIPGRGTAKEIYAKQIENTYKQIESVPSADVVEKKHGQWKKAYLDHEAFWIRPTVVYCSECNLVGYWESKYCPNCGADMRGES